MHSKLALQGGLGAGMVEDIKRTGASRRGCSTKKKAVYNFCRELHASGRVSDETFAYVKSRNFGLDGALELIALNGYYTLMAMVLEQCRVTASWRRFNPLCSRSARLLVPHGPVSHAPAPRRARTRPAPRG